MQFVLKGRGRLSPAADHEPLSTFSMVRDVVLSQGLVPTSKLGQKRLGQLSVIVVKSIIRLKDPREISSGLW